jgi:hypothetical protein
MGESFNRVYDVVAEFVNGPHDGRVMALPNLPLSYLFPVLATPLTFDPAPDVSTIATKAMVYKLAHDPDTHRPSINDAGRYRYVYQGIR